MPTSSRRGVVAPKAATRPALRAGQGRGASGKTIGNIPEILITQREHGFSRRVGSEGAPHSADSRTRSLGEARTKKPCARHTRKGAVQAYAALLRFVLGNGQTEKVGKAPTRIAQPQREAGAHAFEHTSRAESRLPGENGEGRRLSVFAPLHGGLRTFGKGENGTETGSEPCG